MKTYLFTGSDDDVLKVRQLREKLRTIRTDRKMSAAALARKMQRSPDTVSAMEGKRKGSSPLVSTLQHWAGGLDLRMEFEVKGLAELNYPDPHSQALFDASRPWGADEQMRMWLVAALRTWRVAKGVDVEVLATTMKLVEGRSIREWEANTRDPYLFRAMHQARMLGTEVSWQLLDQDRNPV